MKFCHLSENPNLLPKVRKLLVDTWPGWYGKGGDAGEEKLESDLADFANDQPFPTLILAINGNNEVMGCAGLKSEAHGQNKGKRHWMTTLVVVEKHRGKRVATNLIEQIELEAQKLKFEDLYVATHNMTTAFKMRGWERVDELKVFKEYIGIFVKDLSKAND